MSDLLERRVVRCPYHLAQRYLADEIGSRLESPGPLTLVLSLPGVEVVKEVTVTYDSAVDPMHFDQPWRIHWQPKSGPYPVFDGELTVRADETYETSQLELTGAYRPPGGVLGAAFDKAVGSRIASATAQAVLEDFARELERRYQHDEAQKPKSTGS
jgi:hypothetical protein